MRAGTSTTRTSATRRCSIASWRGWSETASARDLFERLAVVEDRHAARWEELFAGAGRPLPPYRTSRRTRALAWVARTFGPSSILPLDAGGRGTRGAGVSRPGAAVDQPQTHKAAVDIASDSAVHARELSEVMGREGEPWHVGGAGGLLRSIVYGFNDGLTANFGLVAGVIGASVCAARRDRQRRGRRDRRRAVDGIERLSRGQERGGSAGAPDRDGAPGDAADARSRGRGARASSTRPRGCRRERARETAKAMMQDPAQRARDAGARGAEHPSGGARAAEGRPGHRHRHRGRRVHSDRCRSW